MFRVNAKCTKFYESFLKQQSHTWNQYLNELWTTNDKFIVDVVNWK